MMVGGSGGANTMSGADVWRVLRANLWLIVTLLVVSMVSGYFVNKYLAAHYSKFSSAGLIGVHPSLSLNPLDEDRGEIAQSNVALEQRSQVQKILHESLASKVITNSKPLRETAWFLQFNGSAQDAKKDLLKSLSVTPIQDTRLIRVSMTTPNREDCAVIVREVVDQHLQDERKRNNDAQYDRSTLLTNMKVRNQMRLNEIGGRLRDRSVKLGVDGIGGSGRINVKDEELSRLVQLQLEMELKAEAARGQRDGIMKQLAAGQDPAGVEESVRMDPTISMYRQMLTNAELQAGELEQQVGPNSPQLQKAQSRVSGLQTRLDSEINATKAKSRVAIAEMMEGQVAEVTQSMEKITRRVDDIKGELGDLSNQMADYLTLRDEEEAYREQLNAVNKQLEQMTTIQGRIDLSTVSWSTQPETPDSPTFPKLPQTMALAVFAGLALSLGISFLREMLDTSVRSPRDIARIGQMPMLGMVAHESDDPQSAGARLPLVIFEAPHSMLAEQFRQVRTRLQHAASLDTTRSILVTSPGPGDGKSVVATNLAAGLALNGRRILLVDANFRRPELHKIFGVGNEQGLSDVLNNLDNFDSLIQETAVPNLAVLPSGPKPTNATELLESQLLIDFIERALEEFDHVVFDSGPMLFVSESVALAPRVDGVVTVVRARSNSRGLLQRMRDGLRQVKAEHLGVVLNAVRSQGGGYYGRNIKTYYEYQNAQ